MSNLQAGVDQRVISDVMQWCADLAGELKEKARAPPESERARRMQVKDMDTLQQALNAIKNRLDASTSLTKGTGGSKYVAARHAAASKLTVLEHGGELPSRPADKVQGFLQNTKRKLDQGELPTPKRGKENRWPRNAGTGDASQPDQDALMQELLSLSPGTKLDIQEAVRRLEGLNPGKKRNTVIRAWSLDRGSGIVKMQRKGIQKRMQKLDAGAVAKALKVKGQVGHTPLATLEEIQSWVKAHPTGQTFGLQDVRKMLESKAGHTVAEQTVRNYFALALSECETATGAAKHKQPQRDAAERSLRRVQALAVSVLASHILPGPSAVASAPNKNHDAVKAVSQALGGIEVHAIDEAMIFNTDDTSLYIHTGLASKSEIRGVPSKGDQVHFASYRLDNPAPDTIMSVHMSCISSAAGLSGPIVIRVKVKEREWVGARGDWTGLSPVILELKQPPAQIEVATIKPILVSHDVSASTGRVITQMRKASSCLEDNGWQDLVKTSLIGRVQDSVITLHDTEKCDLLCDRLLERLEQHLTERVAPGRRNHWCVDFVRVNMGRCSAIVGGVNGHIRERVDTHHVHPDESLLVSLTKRFLKVFDGYEDAEGCYVLGTEQENGMLTEIARSGKVCSGTTLRGMGKRHGEHEAASRLDKEKPSRFNMTYPSQDIEFRDPIRRGNFQDLTMYVGTAFDRNDHAALNNICATDGTGIFEWPPHVLRNLKSTSWGSMDMQAKQLNMVSFLLELVYDLCISRQLVGPSRLNLSDSPATCLRPPTRPARALRLIDRRST